MPKIQIGEWLPDLAGLNGSQTAENVKPLGAGYKQLEAGEVITGSLVARCQGFGTAQDVSGDWFSYAGDATDLYMAASNSWASAFAAGATLGATERWEFVNWPGEIIALSKGEEPLDDTIGTGAFSTFMTSTLKPKAATGTVIKSHLVLGNYNDGTEFRDGVIWSATGDYKDFDASVTTGSGADRIASGGTVQRVIGGEYGTIFTENAIWLMTFEGPPTLFRFDPISRNVGAIAPGAVIPVGNSIYFLSSDGFRRLDGTTLTDIGENKVDETVLGLLDHTNLHRVSSAFEPMTGLIYFSYPTASGNPDRLAIYNPKQQRWADASFEHELIMLDYTKSITLEDANWTNIALDDPSVSGISLDDPRFQGGVAQIGHIDTAHRVQWWLGTGRTATVDTPEQQFFEAKRAFLNKARPYVEGSSASITVSVGTREQLSDAVSFGTAVAPNSFGEVPLRDSGRFITLRQTITGGFNDVVGIEAEPKPAGGR